MVDGGASVVAEHVLVGRGAVCINVGRVDDVPFLVGFEIMEFWRPAVVGI